MTASNLLPVLMADAGLDDQQWTVAPLAGEGLINMHDLVQTADGERFVYRRYGWPWAVEEPLDRMAKEAWLIPRLFAAGVPVPEVMAAGRQDDEEGLLMRFVEGDVLAAAEPRTDAMWHAAGAALREVHEVDIGLAGQPVGMIVHGGVEPSGGGLGAWHLESAIRHGYELAAAQPDLAIDVDRCAGVVAAAAPMFDAQPRAVVHADANPWNVLVTPDGGRATWIDWEFAWWSDPLYDFVRLMLARKRDLGPVPTAFFAGYGEDPTGHPLFEVCALGFHLWMANEMRNPLLADRTTYKLSERYLLDLPGHLDRLEALGFTD